VSNSSLRGITAALPLVLSLGCGTPRARAGEAAPPPTPPVSSGSTTASAASAPPAAAPTSATAAAPSSMAGHVHTAGMAMPITIPKGAQYTEADVQFMQGMIAHHAQAIFMSRMAASHGANPRLQRFAMKIDQSQDAEIRLMQEWLRANNQFAPDTSSWRTMQMSGMLTPEQLSELDKSRGVEFERNFLRFMIQHHEGALKMVKDLFATPRAGQDIDISVFANDVEVVQTAEIALMRQMLEDL
jgi:uncharacterized protein (DUF305 family)